MPRVPFKVGDVVVGDEPLNGRNEGIVAVVRGRDVGLRCTSAAKAHFVYYDYRNVQLAQ